MGVSVREKPKASGYCWLFVRHRGQRVCQYIGQDKEVAEDAAKDIQRTDVTTKKTIARPFSKASIRIITASLCACLNREDGHIQENPANRLTRFYRQAKAMHPEIQPLTAAEAPVFLKAAREHSK